MQANTAGGRATGRSSGWGHAAIEPRRAGRATAHQNSLDPRLGGAKDVELQAANEESLSGRGEPPRQLHQPATNRAGLARREGDGEPLLDLGDREGAFSFQKLGRVGRTAASTGAGIAASSESRDRAARCFWNISSGSRSARSCTHPVSGTTS